MTQTNIDRVHAEVHKLLRHVYDHMVCMGNIKYGVEKNHGKIKKSVKKNLMKNKGGVR